VQDGGSESVLWEAATVQVGSKHFQAQKTARVALMVTTTMIVIVVVYQSKVQSLAKRSSVDVGG
jgi:hypothetical protein